MLKYILNFAIVIILGFSISSCGGNDGPDCNDEEALEQFFTASTSQYFTALQRFSADPSESNCKALLDAVNEFIDDAGSVRDCVPTSDRAEFDRSLDEARDSLIGTDCN